MLSVMRWALLAAVLLASPAVADPQPPAAKAPAAATARPAAKPATCKRRVVGKGLDRKVVCELEQEVVVTSGAPKPNVVIAPVDGRKVTGRPKLTDPFSGLPRQRTAH